METTMNVTQSSIPTPLTVQKYFTNPSVRPILTEKTTLYIDQLRKFAVHDPSRIQKGDKVLFLHVPSLTDTTWNDHKLSAYGNEVEITEVGMKTFAELHPVLTNPLKTDPALVFLYKREHSESYRHASDAGVIPYEGNWRNDVNFTVLVSDLEKAGVEVILEASPEYRREMEKVNETIVEHNYYDDYEDAYPDYEYEEADA